MFLGFYIFIFSILGLAVGSFINAVVFRLQTKKPIFWSRSVCPKCQKKIAWFDNIPLLSFLILKGRCRHCQQKISWQYPAVELATAIIFLLLYLKFGLSLKLLSLIVFSTFLIVIFVYDLKYYLILDRITIPVAIIALIFNLFLGFKLFDLILGALIIAGFFYLQFAISRGQWIGGGDIRLGLVMGLMLGWKLGLAALFLAYIIGALVGLGLIIFGKKKLSSRIPFGTFLSLATLLTLLYGEEILNWYLSKILF